MRKYIAPRRYLVSFDSEVLPQIFCDVLVLGAGVAGLRAALAAAEHGSVILVSKAEADESNTKYAQGGVAGVLSPEDSVGSHVNDTVAVGQGLSDEAAVQAIVSEGPERIRELIAWGARFDCNENGLDLAQEGGHSRPRIAHAQGDATGAEIERTLHRLVSRHAGIQMVDFAFGVDVLTNDDDRAVGMLLLDRRWGLMLVWAKQTVLATGGTGKIYRESTNPHIATGDGFGIAYRAGCELRGLEFMQFHPTTLYLAGASRSLISETVRGYGAVLRNKSGEAFMKRYHPQGDLAPRDAVSIGVVQEMRRTNATNVFLDLTHLDRAKTLERFPVLARLCSTFDLDISANMIPVRPSAHYTIGGITTDLAGRTTVAGLWACGEVASTGLHGANRLGSNSLLEGLVCGCRAGDGAGRAAAGRAAQESLRVRAREIWDSGDMINTTDVTNALHGLMWRNVGIERNATLLEDAIRTIDSWCSYVMDKEFSDSGGWQLQNMLTTAKLMAGAALRRRETRGVHHRTDFPARDDVNWRRCITYRRANAL